MPALESSSATTEDSKDTHSFEYLVIYVHFIDRIIKRLSSKGFKMKMPTKTISDIKVAILKDPSGIEVRLMELSPIFLGENEADKKPVRF